MAKFNQKEYMKEYKKTHYKKFACDLPIEEYEEVTNLCKEKKVNKVDVVRKGIEWLKNKKSVK